MEQQLEEAGPSFRKSEQVLKSVSKGDFLDLLKNPSRSDITRQKDGYDDGEAPKRWDVLDDEYLTGKAFAVGSSDEAEDSGAESDSGGSLEEVF